MDACCQFHRLTCGSRWIRVHAGSVIDKDGDYDILLRGSMPEAMSFGQITTPALPASVTAPSPSAQIHERQPLCGRLLRSSHRPGEVCFVAI